MIFDWNREFQIVPGIVIGFGMFAWSPSPPFGNQSGWVQVFMAANDKRGGA